MYTNGFLNNKVDFLFHRDIFLNHHTHIYIDKEDNQTVKSYDADVDYKIGDIVAVVGEFFEREELIDSVQKRRDKIEAVSLIDGKKKEIETGRIVMKDRFVDSCGMASHYISDKVIEKAYLEFFERQCFIYSFLSKEKAEKIDVKLFCKCKKKDFYLKNYVDRIEYYNISLDEEVFVILALGYGKRKKAIGMGTETDIEKAIDKSQNEMLQNFAAECSKSNFADIGWEKTQLEDRDMYDKLFVKMSLNQFEEEYRYLESEKKEVLYNPKRDLICMNLF